MTSESDGANRRRTQEDNIPLSPTRSRHPPSSSSSSPRGQRAVREQRPAHTVNSQGECEENRDDAAVLGRLPVEGIRSRVRKDCAERLMFNKSERQTSRRADERL
ncbi:hypothetical protein JOB18_003359 [Solea senegalensis]|uniref:Uncharacterized protein n=1 Tax=Solea senegalensis TaxID=28829 RepID=A0AAV6R3I7_SOLSE|nr:hypothetical protein JOB18_003359 [Solea senegalensis]